jgi:hypothetical protein
MSPKKVRIWLQKEIIENGSKKSATLNMSPKNKEFNLPPKK